MKKLTGLLVPLATLLVISVPAHAQNQYRLEIFGAETTPIGKSFEISTPQSSIPLKGIHDFSFAGRGGIRLGVDGTGHWGQDLIYSYGTNASRIINNTTQTRFAFTNRIHQISYNALWYPGGLNKRKVFPYLTAGVGGTLYVLTQTTVNEALDPNRAGVGKLRNDNIFAFNAGAGIRFRVNSLYGFRVDVRDYLTRPPRYGLPKSSNNPNATVFPVGGIFHQIEVSFAFVYYF